MMCPRDLDFPIGYIQLSPECIARHKLFDACSISWLRDLKKH